MTEERLRLDRTVSFGLVLALTLQSAGALMWVGRTEARLAELGRVQVSRAEVSQRLARLEGETAMMRGQLTRIEQVLSRAD